MGRLVSKIDFNTGKSKNNVSFSGSKDSKTGSDKVSLNLVKRDKNEILSSKNKAYNYLAL